MQRITISEVARLAGVSITTASKALNGTGNISPETVQRVIEAANSLGYKPNRAAQFLSGKRKHIGIIMPVKPEPVYDLFNEGINEAMSLYGEYGFTSTTVKYETPMDDIATFKSELNELKSSVDGLIFIGGYNFREYRDIIEGLSIPKAALQLSVDRSICPSVTVDEFGVGRMAADFLSLISDNASIIIGGMKISTHVHNVEGFRFEAEKHSLALNGVYECYDSLDNAYDITEKLLKTGRPDSIFVASYVAPAVCACLKDLNLSGEVKVLGVDIWQKSVECLNDGSMVAGIY
nr:LacI family DNA-binding transcriptional regulator [Clostridia bacterium]